MLKNQDFKEVLDNHQNVSRENFTIYYKKNNSDHCRVGVSVSSKIGNSVVRHKIKRQVVSMVDKLLNVSIPLDVVVIVRKKYLNNSYSENFNAIERFIKDILKKEKLNEK